MVKQKKKAVSQLIATVLLISLVLVIAMIIFFWVRGFVSEQIEKFGAPAEESCKDINFDAELQSDSSILYIFNKGNVNIADFSIKTYKDGNSEISSLGGGVLSGDVHVYDLISLSDPETIKYKIQNSDKVVVYPDILGLLKGTSKTKSFSCEENSGKVIKG
jgi:FlaG/FlaF family flagellin (archaellin)